MFQLLQDIYIEYGYGKEKGISVVRKGKSGAEEIVQMMKNYRENPPKEIAGSSITEIRDYKEQTKTLANGAKETMDDIPKSNVLIYYTEDGTKVCVRPSGTEPKIKFYVSVKDQISSNADFKEKLVSLEAKINTVKADLNL